MPSRPRSLSSMFAVFAPLVLSACPFGVIIGDNPQEDTGTATATTTTGGPSSSTGGPAGGTDTGGTPTTGVHHGYGTRLLPLNRGTDILFVIDNSGSMAGSQARLAQAIASFVERLDDRSVHYKIGVTTTDSGNPRCSNTTPEHGALVLSSCLDRVALGEFTLEKTGDDFSSACTDFCTLHDADLEIRPTATHSSKGELAPRKWVEMLDDETNLPDGVEVADALRCFLPQGVSGCGFASHLESMFLALTGANDPDSPTNFGFLRDDAGLAVIIVTDETDCSLAPEFQDIFIENKIFWEDPNAPEPTSATCWNAGVTCEGAGPVFTGCSAANKSSTGEIDVSDDLAVLRPLSRYTALVDAIEEQKQAVDPHAEVLVALIAGVPPGYDAHEADIVYQDSPDPVLQSSFGIGPGCVDGEHVAVPPVREREFAEAFAIDDTRDVYSVCADDFRPALLAIADRLGDQIRPACMPNCVLDTDPNTPTVEPNCTLVEISMIDQSETEIAPCELVDGEMQAPPGATVCFFPRVDPGGQTPATHDDMSPECAAEGYNLEIGLLRSAPPLDAIMISATCELSPDKAQDCPML